MKRTFSTVLDNQLFDKLRQPLWCSALPHTEKKKYHGSLQSPNFDKKYAKLLDKIMRAIYSNLLFTCAFKVADFLHIIKHVSDKKNSGQMHLNAAGHEGAYPSCIC